MRAAVLTISTSLARGDGPARVAVPEDPALVAILAALRERRVAGLAAFAFGPGAEPPVATPAAAVALWREAGLDALVLGGSLVERNG